MPAQWGQLSIALPPCWGETGTRLGLLRPGCSSWSCQRPFVHGKTCHSLTLISRFTNQGQYFLSWFQQMHLCLEWEFSVARAAFIFQFTDHPTMRTESAISVHEPYFLLSIYKGELSSWFLSYYCSFSARNIKFKNLSLISCRNIISLMDVSFQISAHEAKWRMNVIVHNILHHGWQKWIW